MIVRDRRKFLQAGSLILGAIGTEACSSVEAATPHQEGAAGSALVASLGFEVANILNNGADVYFPVAKKMQLLGVTADIAASIAAAGPGGFGEVLCRGAITRQAAPKFGNGAAFPTLTASSDFGTVQPVNPNGLTIVYDPNLAQDQFLSVILKTWIPPDGSGSATYRNVTTAPNLALNAGDYLLFHMDHVGAVPIDVEMQVVLSYELL